jgi:hypothetical protein
MAKFLEKTMFSLLIKKKNTKRKHERKKNQINIFHDLASLKNTKKIIYFLYFACIMDLITSLLNPWRLDLNFTNTKKISLFIFNIKHYEFIRNMYFQY